MAIYREDAYPIPPTFQRRDVMFLDDGMEGGAYVHLDVLDQIFEECYIGGLFDRIEHELHMRHLDYFHNNGHIAPGLFRLPPGMQHPYWRILSDNDTRVHFHVLAEALFQEYHLPIPIELFDHEGWPDADELHADLHHVLKEWVEDVIDDNYCAGAA